MKKPWNMNGVPLWLNKAQARGVPAILEWDKMSLSSLGSRVEYSVFTLIRG